MSIEETEKQVLEASSKLIKLMKNTKSKKQYKILRIEYLTLYDLADDLDIDIPNFEDFTYRFDEDEDMILFEKEYLERNSKEENFFIANLLDLPEVLTTEVPLFYEGHDIIRRKSSIDLDVQITRGFLSKYDKDLLDLFDKRVDGSRFIVAADRFENNSFGVTYTMESVNKNFVIINDFETLDTALTMIHETGHLYQDKYTTNHTNEGMENKMMSNFVEVFSLFLEYLGNDYLFECKYINEREHRQAKINFIQEIYNQIKNLCDFELENEFPIYQNALYYGIGGLVALEYYDQYLRDPETTKDNIKQMLKDSETKSMEELLNSNGLDIENIMSFDTIIRHTEEIFDNKVLKKK